MMLWTLLTYIVKDSELFPAQLLLLPSRFSCVQLCATPWTVACQGPLSVEFSRQSTEVGCHALLQGLFPTQGSNPRLPHCRQILYHLSHQRIPRRLEWVAYPFSREFSQLESNQSLLHWRWILYQLSYQGSPFQHREGTTSDVLCWRFMEVRHFSKLQKELFGKVELIDCFRN